MERTLKIPMLGPPVSGSIRRGMSHMQVDSTVVHHSAYITYIDLLQKPDLVDTTTFIWKLKENAYSLSRIWISDHNIHAKCYPYNKSICIQIVQHSECKEQSLSWKIHDQLLVESYIWIFNIYLVTLHFCIIFKKLLPGFQDCTNPKNEIHPHHELFFYTRKWLRWLTWEQSRSPVTMRQNLGGRTGRQKIHRSAGYRSHPLQQFARLANIAGGRNHIPW